MKAYTAKDIENQGLTIVRNNVYDLSLYKTPHMGGDFLDLFKGHDITFTLSNAHITNKKTFEKLNELKVGKISKEELDEETRDLRDLEKKYRALGYFDYKSIWFFFDFIKIAIPFFIGLALIPYSRPLALVILSLHVLLACWWVHDVGHSSIFKNEKRSRFWCGFISTLFTGTHAIDYHFIAHRVHHGVTNILKKDGALMTGPIFWDESQESKLGRLIFPYRTFLWVGIILPSVFFLFLLANVVTSLISVKRLWIIPALALRWAFFYFLIFNQDLVMSLVPVVVGGFFLSLISSFNHFHMEKTHTIEHSFLKSVSKTTHNISDYSFWWTEFTGSLNFHIEHHIFAYMPRRNYPKIQNDIRALFLKHNLDYHEKNKLQTISLFLSALRGDYIYKKADMEMSYV